MFQRVLLLSIVEKDGKLKKKIKRKVMHAILAKLKKPLIRK